MNSILKLSFAFPLVLSSVISNAQIKNMKIDTVTIYGNCELCETKIESAGTVKKVALVDWIKDSKKATITYDSVQTNLDEILKRIALVGYDSDKFLSPDDVYAKLPECCQYERVNKTENATSLVMEDHSMHNQVTLDEANQEVNQLAIIFTNYFALKNALVNSDAQLTSTAAAELLVNINAVKMSELTPEEHVVWMKIVNGLKSNTDKISNTTNLENQRNDFMALSESFYDLLKVSKQETTIYYQYCPMYNGGESANWLSTESAVKNPYYGAQMLNCGKTIDTIK